MVSAGVVFTSAGGACSFVAPYKHVPCQGLGNGRRHDVHRDPMQHHVARLHHRPHRSTGPQKQRREVAPVRKPRGPVAADGAGAEHGGAEAEAALRLADERLRHGLGLAVPVLLRQLRVGEGVVGAGLRGRELGPRQGRDGGHEGEARPPRDAQAHEVGGPEDVHGPQGPVRQDHTHVRGVVDHLPGGAAEESRARRVLGTLGGQTAKDEHRASSPNTPLHACTPAVSRCGSRGFALRLCSVYGKRRGGRVFNSGGGWGTGTRPRYQIVCLWRRLLASRHCSF